MSRIGIKSITLNKLKTEIIFQFFSLATMLFSSLRLTGTKDKSFFYSPCLHSTEDFLWTCLRPLLHFFQKLKEYISVLLRKISHLCILH